MHLTIVRHGIAVDLYESGANTDAERMLSPEGIERTRAAAQGFSALGYRPRLLASSPLRRALETAEIFAREVAAPLPIEQTDALLPAADPDDTIEWLAAREDAGDVMVFGHMPHVASLAATLLVGEDVGDIQFKKAAACRVALEHGVGAGEGVLEWLLQPRHLRALAS